MPFRENMGFFPILFWHNDTVTKNQETYRSFFKKVNIFTVYKILRGIAFPQNCQCVSLYKWVQVQ